MHRVSVFSLSVLLGIGVVQLTSGMSVFSCKGTDTDTASIVTEISEQSEGLALKFVGVSTEDETEYAAFTVTNEGRYPVTYSAYSAGFPVYLFKIDGKENPQRWCGTGLKEFKLEPAKSIDVSIRVPRNLTSENGSHQVMVGISSSDEPTTGMIWTKEIKIPNLRNQK